MGSGSEFQIVGAADENDLQPYFFNFADGKGLPFPLSNLSACNRKHQNRSKPRVNPTQAIYLGELWGRTVV